MVGAYLHISIMGAPSHVFVRLAVNLHVFIWMLSYVHVDECSFTCILIEGAHLYTSTRWRSVLVEWACPCDRMTGGVSLL